MKRNPIDHDHLGAENLRTPRYSRLDRINAGEGGHVSVRMLMRRYRKPVTETARVKHFLRIARGYLA
ncbi:MAG: hypothetical protein LJE68_17650 [Rhodobacter sp.]|jgi:hypothetical protein|nr:hypothetical protein [Rhodobacter sp.]